MEDYYAVLGVNQDATKEEIKKAYRAMARTFHPDRNPGNAEAEAKFKAAAEAYRVIGDDDLRSEYDAARNGANGEADVDQAAAGSPSDVFGEIFGGRGGKKSSDPRSKRREAGDAGGARAPTRERPSSGSRGAERGHDLRYVVELDLEDVAVGTRKRIRVPRHERCDRCHGTGARAGSAPMLCKACGGTGTVKVPQGFFEVAQRCGDCRGSGRIVPHNCSACGGTGELEGETSLDVEIPPGVDEGTRLKLSGEGELGREGAPSGDLFVVVKVREHPFFTRDGDDLVAEVPISMAQAALGTQIEVPTVEGPVRMRIPAGSQPGRVFRLKGKGIQSRGGQGRGDQRVRIQVEVPTSLTAEQKELFERLMDSEDQAPVPGESRVREYLEKMRRHYR